MRTTVAPILPGGLDQSATLGLLQKVAYRSICFF